MSNEMDVLYHSSIVIKNEKVIYIDPFKIKKVSNDADIILITHEHYDHFSEDDIEKVKKEDTIIILTKDLLQRALSLGFKNQNILTVEPNKEYALGKIKIQTIPAYNIGKPFHPKENNWVGYIIEIKGIRYYIAGDTDLTEENKKVKCDIAFVPIGGTYTMDFREAANLINQIKPKLVVPIHYGEIVGNRKDAQNFKKMLNSEIKCNILIKK